MRKCTAVFLLARDIVYTYESGSSLQLHLFASIEPSFDNNVHNFGYAPQKEGKKRRMRNYHIHFLTQETQTNNSNNIHEI